MIFGIFRLIGVGLFLYLTWRNLKENYQEDKLISYAWLAVLAFMVGGRLIFGFVNWGVWNDNWMDWLSFWQHPGYNFWGGVGAIFLITIWYCKVSTWKLWPFLEEMTPIIYTLWLFIFIDEWIRSGFSLNIGILVSAALVGLAVSGLVSKRYRSFGWYKSGKKGFSFLFTNMVVCFILALFGWFLLEDIVFAVIFSILGLISGVGLFILGGVFDSL